MSSGSSTAAAPAVAGTPTGATTAMGAPINSYTMGGETFTAARATPANPSWNWKGGLDAGMPMIQNGLTGAMSPKGGGSSISAGLPQQMPQSANSRFGYTQTNPFQGPFRV